MNSIKLIYLFQEALQIDFKYIILLQNNKMEGQIDKLFVLLFIIVVETLVIDFGDVSQRAILTR